MSNKSKTFEKYVIKLKIMEDKVVKISLEKFRDKI